jgi:hypothetical protein
MANEDQEARRSRVVVETPTVRREVTQTESLRVPERSGISGATVGVIVVVAVALVTILVLVLLNNQANQANNANLAAQQQPAPVPQTTIIQQPAAQQQPPVIIQQPAPATQPAPVIVNPPAPAGGSTTSVSADAAIQAKIDKKIQDDPTYFGLGITATVLDGKVTLVGMVKNDAMKLQIERMIKAIRGVKSVDNQIIVNAGG